MIVVSTTCGPFHLTLGASAFRRFLQRQYLLYFAATSYTCFAMPQGKRRKAFNAPKTAAVKAVYDILW